MSRLAAKPLEIPKTVTMTAGDGFILAKGPLGELKRNFKTDNVSIDIGEKEIIVKRKDTGLFSKALVGTYASTLLGMMEGVTKGFEKTLVVEGTGYKANISGNNLVLSLGYSHDIEMPLPEGVEAKVEKEVIKISGIDKIKVGQFAANVRAKRKPEPYKGKGVRYQGEVIERKQGKKAVT